jgi:MFS family permease
MHLKNKRLIILALFLLTFFSASHMTVASPVLAQMGKDLNVTNASTLSLILTLPALCMIPMNLLSGVLGQRMSKKILVYIGGVIFMVGALGPIFLYSFTAILVFRAIMGLGCGIIFPHPISMIADYFEDERRPTVMGIVNAGGGVLAMIVAIVAGVLGTTSWRNAFWSYTFGAIAILAVTFFVPTLKTAVPAAAGPRKIGSLAPSTYIYMTALFVFFATIQIVFNLISSFVFAEKMGNASSAGTAVSIMTLGSFLTSISFGVLFGILKKWSGFVSVAVAAIGYILLAMSPSLPIVIGAMLVIGLGMGAFIPIVMTWSAMDSPNAVSLATSITLIGMLLGMFGSTFVLQLFKAIGGGSTRNSFLYSGILLGFMAIVFLFAALRPSRRTPFPAMSEEALSVK